MKNIFCLVCLQFLLISALQATENKIIIDYGQNLDSLVSYDKNGKFISKTLYFFEQDLLKQATIETDKNISIYKYIQEQDYYQEEIIAAEKSNSAGTATINSWKKTTEQDPDKTAEYNYIWQNNSWKKSNGTISFYTENLLTRFEEVENDDDEWQTSKWIDYLYYTSAENVSFAGKLKEVHSFADGKTTSSKTTYQYTLVGGVVCLLSEIVYTVDNSKKFQKCMSAAYTYPSNNQDNVVCVISYFDPDTQNLIGKDQYTISTQSGLLSSHKTELFNATNQPIQLRENIYIYSNNNQTVEEKNSISDLLAKKTKIQQSRFSTILDNNKPINVSTEILSDNNWIKEEELAILYNSDEKLIQKEVRKYTSSDNISIPIYKTEWNFNSNSGADTYTSYIYDESLSLMVKDWSFVVFYPGDGNNIKLIETNPKEIFSIYPNPASEYIFISGNIDFNSPIQYSIYNLTGRLEKKGTVYSSEDRILVTDLAPGNYVLRFLKDGKYTSCVFVKHT